MFCDICEKPYPKANSSDKPVAKAEIIAIVGVPVSEIKNTRIFEIFNPEIIHQGIRLFNTKQFEIKSSL